MYNKIKKEICDELNIKYTFLSKDWITKLEYNNKIKYLSQNKFDINGYVVGKIMDDKYATYSVLKNLDIPVCEHNIFYKEDNMMEFAKNCNTKKDMLSCFKKYNSNVVVKPNLGYQGNDVYHITNEKELLKVTTNLFKNNYSISMCPFYEIKNEYRVIVLDNEIKLIYKKINPTVVGDGISTLKELLIVFNKSYFTDKNIPNIILKKGETYTYDFRFNLSKGAIASVNIDLKLKDKLEKLSLDIAQKIGIRFASIDIIETMQNDILVLEINNGVTINKAIAFIPNGYEIAKEIYKEAIIKMFAD